MAPFLDARNCGQAPPSLDAHFSPVHNARLDDHESFVAAHSPPVAAHIADRWLPNSG